MKLIRKKHKFKMAPTLHKKEPARPPRSWKVLVVDDEADIHAVTLLNLKGFEYEGRGLTIYSAMSGREARELLEKEDGFALALVDVVMESDDAGLLLVDHIRNKIGDTNMRIVIRTGQPGYAPEREILNSYDIDDYKEKGELTVNKLYTTVRAAIKSYGELLTLSRQRAEIEVDFTRQQVVSSMLELTMQPLSFAELMNKALDHILSVAWLEKPVGAIYLRKPATDLLVLQCQRGFSTEQAKKCAVVELGDCFCGRAAHDCALVFADGTEKCREESCGAGLPHGHYSVPIMDEGESIGVLTVRVEENHQYTFKEEMFLVAVSRTLAGIINRSRQEEEKKQFQKQFQQSQKMEALGTLAGGIAHDFNNILTPIIGYAQIAKIDLAKDSHHYKYCDTILTAARRAQDLVQQILTFSRRHEQEVEPLMVQPIVKEALKLLRSSLPVTIELKEDIDPEVGSIIADPTQIHQIVMNLCTNAYHAMEESSGIIYVILKSHEITSDNLPHGAELKPGSHLCIQISDTGCGIDEEIIGQIFDPFFTTKEIGKGTGMGLSVIHGIVKNNKGHIMVESCAGEGTTFTLFLPCAEQAVEQGGPQNRDNLPRGSEHILLVDDQEMVLMVEQETLSLLGYKVTIARSASKGLELFKEQPDTFDLVVTDQTMPELSGLKLAEQLRSVRPQIPIILCSGDRYSVSEEAIKEMGVKFILKPFDLEKISRAVREMLSQ